MNSFAEFARRACPESEAVARRYHLYADGSFYETSFNATSWSVVVAKQSDVGFNFCVYLAGRAANGASMGWGRKGASNITGELNGLLWSCAEARSNYAEYEVHDHADCEVVMGTADGQRAIESGFQLAGLSTFAAEEVEERMRARCLHV